jgi:hypothetical protein
MARPLVQRSKDTRVEAGRNASTAGLRVVEGKPSAQGGPSPPGWDSLE